MPIGRRNIAVVIVSAVGSLPPGRAFYGAIDYGSFSATPHNALSVYSLSTYSLSSINLPNDAVIVGALVYTGPNYSTIPPTFRKIGY